MTRRVLKLSSLNGDLVFITHKLVVSPSVSWVCNETEWATFRSFLKKRFRNESCSENWKHQVRSTPRFMFLKRDHNAWFCTLTTSTLSLVAHAVEDASMLTIAGCSERDLTTRKNTALPLKTKGSQ